MFSDDIFEVTEFAALVRILTVKKLMIAMTILEISFKSLVGGKTSLWILFLNVVKLEQMIWLNIILFLVLFVI